MIQIETTLIQATHDGFPRELLRFTPTLKHPCCRNATLAVFEAWLDEPGTHAAQKAACMKSALQSLAMIGEEAKALLEKQA
jgi:predicted PhzF superfamily epimerase YddE/YHI9